VRTIALIVHTFNNGVVVCTVHTLWVSGMLLLQEYVLEQIRQFAVEFAQQLVPNITQQHLDLAFSRALYALSARSSQQALKLQLRFTHKCK